MGHNQFYIHEETHMEGPANCFVWDSAMNAWGYLGRVLEPSISFETPTKINRTKVQKGIIRKTGEKVKEQNASLSMTLLERGHGRLTHLLLLSRGDAQTITSTPSIGKFSDTFEMFEEVGYNRFYDSGYATLARLDPLTSANGSAAGTAGSGWTTGNNYFWTVPLYGNMGAFSSFIAGADYDYQDVLDVHFTAGTPVASGAVNIGGATATVTIAVILPALGQQEVLPNGYAIFHSLSNNILTAKLNIVAPNTLTRAGGTQNVAIITGPHAGSDTYIEAIGLSVESIADPDTLTPTFTKVTEGGGTWTWNRSSGVYTNHDATKNGKTFRVNEWYIRPASIQTNLGIAGRASDYREFLFVRVRPTENVRAGEFAQVQGEEMQLYRVNVAGLATQWNFNESGFDSGTPFTAEIMVDTETSQYGEYRYLDRELDKQEQGWGVG